MIIKRQLACLVCSVFFLSCTPEGNISPVIPGLVGALSKDPTLAEMALGIKEALVKGVESSSQNASKTDGFFLNSKIKIPFPSEVQFVEKTLRDFGLGSIVDNVVLRLNRAAEKASETATPILVGAVTSLTIADAYQILTGPKDSATQYLKKMTQAQLIVGFTPIVRSALSEVQLDSAWSELSTRYNSIPFVTPVTTNISAYVTARALEGLFVLVAEEEQKIRENPIERTTELLKKVFEFAAKQATGT